MTTCHQGTQGEIFAGFMFNLKLPPSSRIGTVWLRWHSELVQSGLLANLIKYSNFGSNQWLLLKQPQETQDQTSCCQTPAAWTERDIHVGSHPSQPSTQVLQVVKITYTPHACVQLEAQPHPRTSQAPHTGQQRGRRTGQSLSQTKHLVGCFLSARTGTDHFPRKLLRFLVLTFLFSFVPFSLWEQSHLAATFHQRSCYYLIVGICLPSEETQWHWACSEEQRVEGTLREILPNAMHDVPLKISWMW